MHVPSRAPATLAAGVLACCVLASCAPAPSVVVTDQDLAAAPWKVQREQDGRRDKLRDLGLKYEEDWRVKVEKVGSELYDAEPPGKPAGNLRLTVAINPDGSVRSTVIDRPSGSELLDGLALKTVAQASPFAPLPGALAGYDQAVISRTWFFGPNLGVRTR